MQRLFLGFAWLLLSTGVIVTTIAGLQSYFWYQSTQAAIIAPPSTEVAIAAPQNFRTAPQVKGVQSIMETEDGRAELVSRFLSRHDSPLSTHQHFGQVFVDLSDKYGIDFRLLPAIAMQESNLCKRIPEGSFNCLGFGIHSRGTLAFTSYEANFERAAKELKKNYIDIGLTTPEEIMTKYTPSSNGSWAASVNQWMAEMRYDDRQLGRETKINADVLEFAQPAATTSAQPTPVSSPSSLGRLLKP